MDLHYQTITGKQVVIEPLQEKHSEGLFAIGREIQDWQYLPIPGLASVKEAQAWVDAGIALRNQGEHFPFVLTRPGSGELMGSTRFMNIQPKHNTLEIGYSWLGKDYQCTAVNTETKYLLLTHCFEVIGVNRVELKTDSRNQRSQKAIERIGGVKEGVLRHHMIAQGGVNRDSVIYSFIRSEWEQSKQRLERLLANCG